MAINLLGEELHREFGITKIYTSVVTEVDGPKGFYLNCGFISTECLVEGREIELCLSLESKT
jgi:diamine N-acetyltransferase